MTFGKKSKEQVFLFAFFILFCLFLVALTKQDLESRTKALDSGGVRDDRTPPESLVEGKIDNLFATKTPGFKKLSTDLQTPKPYQLIGNNSPEKIVDVENDQDNIVTEKYEETKISKPGICSLNEFTVYTVHCTYSAGPSPAGGLGGL
jgi:hypothetical protein